MSAAESTYVFSGFAIPALLTALVTLAAAGRVITKHFSRTSLAMVGMTAATALWQVSFAMMYLSVDAGTAATWARVGYACALFIAPTTYHFAVEILRMAERRRVATRIAWLVAAQFAVLTVASDYVISGVRRVWWGFYPQAAGPASILSVLFVAVFAGAAIWEIGRAHQVSRGIERKRLGVFLIALGVACTAFVDYFATYGFAVYPAGWLAALAYTGIAAYAVSRYGLQPITPALAAAEIISTMRDFLVVTDREGRIDFANSSACAMLGYPSTEIVGRQFSDFVVPLDRGDDTTRGARDLEYLFRPKSGPPIELTVSRSPVVREGEATGTVIIGRDLRDRKRYELETRNAVNLLQSTLESTADGILALGSDGDILSWNRRLIDMWRIPRRLLSGEGAAGLTSYMAEQLVDPAEFLGSVHESQAVPDLQTTHLLEFKDGRRVEQYSTGRTASAPGLRVWSFRDVTASRRAEEALRASEARYRLLFEQNAAGVCVATMDGQIVDCNATFAEIIGVSPMRLLQKNLGAVFASPQAWEELRNRLGDSPAIRGHETQLRRRDGSTVWVLQNLAVLGPGDGALVHLTTVDISVRKSVEEQIEFHAYHDVLTQLPNRRLLSERLELSLLAAKRAHRNVGLLFVDLDGFKNVNDTMGHAAGDEVLCEVARRLREVVRRTDTVSRFGGDEFTIMLPDLTDPDDAIHVAQKVLVEIAKPIVSIEPHAALSASVGIAVYPRDGENVETLLAKADDAMYRAKESGSNSFRLAEGTSAQVSRRGDAGV